MSSYGGVVSNRVIVLRNGIVDLSSSPRQGYLYFIFCANALQERYKSFYSLTSYEKKS